MLDDTAFRSCSRAVSATRGRDCDAVSGSSNAGVTILPPVVRDGSQDTQALHRGGASR